MADAIEAHETALAASGGRPGLLSIDNLLSALGRPYSGYFRRIEKKAAALLEGVVRNHGFVDGNKRTAVLLMLLLIDRSGYEIVDLTDSAVSRELEELVVALADRRTDIDATVAWLRPRCRRQPQP